MNFKLNISNIHWQETNTLDPFKADAKVLFNQATKPYFDYYLDRVKQIEQKFSNNSLDQGSITALTIKEIKSSFIAKIRNLFSSKKHILYISEHDAKYEIEPISKKISTIVEKGNYKKVIFDMKSWTKMIYGYRIFMSLHVNVEEII